MGNERVVTADVVVLGTGPAGMAAVAAARAEGATVAAVEARPRIGGNAVLSNGYLAFVGSGMQAEHGIADNEETFLADARRSAARSATRYGIEPNEDLVRLFARESAETYRLLVRRGARFTRFVPRPGQHTVDRILEIADSRMFAHVFTRDFADPAVRTFRATVADRLLTENGRVTGALAHRTDGTVLRFQATGGVVLATGGYQGNPLLRRRYQPESRARLPYLGLAECRGTGHLIGQAVGGDLVNMTFLPPMVIVASGVVENSIAVNSAGQRFHDEAAPFEDRVDRLREQPGQRAWYVLDDQATRQQARLLDQMPHPPLRAATLAELATVIGVPGAALERSVQRWNDFLASGAVVDPDCGRRAMPADRRGCQGGPFTAAPMIEGINFPCGGFRTTTAMQVVDVFGAPIPGLFAAGDCAAGLLAAADLGGLHISGGLTLGRIAGRSAVGQVDTRDHGTVLHAGQPGLPATRLPIVHVPEPV